jgi:thiol:disulfide interchange protein
VQGNGCQETRVRSQEAEVIKQESEPQIPNHAPSSKSPASKGTETVAAIVQQKPVEAVNIQWVNSFDEGLKMAKTRNCPLMVDFYAEWCGWCKKLDKETWTNNDVIQLAKKFICIKIDCDTDRQTPAKYGARSLPTILFMNPEGKVIHQVLGYRDPEDMIAEMSKVML